MVEAPAPPSLIIPLCATSTGSSGTSRSGIGPSGAVASCVMKKLAILLTVLGALGVLAYWLSVLKSEGAFQDEDMS